MKLVDRFKDSNHVRIHNRFQEHISPAFILSQDNQFEFFHHRIALLRSRIITKKYYLYHACTNLEPDKEALTTAYHELSINLEQEKQALADT